MPQTRLRKVALVLAVASVAAVMLASGWWLVQARPSLFVEHMAPGLISDESWRRSIANDPTAHGYSAYGVLQDRKSRAAINEATRDLQSADPYVWFNSALYLGELGEHAAVPYLIKGLRHPAHRAHGEAAAHLQAITGQSFGTNFQAWKTWWENQNPASNFDFEIGA